MRYWIGAFNYKHKTIDGQPLRKEWVRKTSFFAVHDKLSLTHRESEDDVYLYTSEYNVIAKFSAKNLKENWEIKTITEKNLQTKEMLDRYEAELLKIKNLSKHCLAGGEFEEAEGEILVYAGACELDRDETHEYIEPSFLETLREDQAFSFFVPSIKSIWRLFMTEEIIKEDAVALENHDLYENEYITNFGSDLSFDPHGEPGEAETTFQNIENGWYYGE